MDKHALIQNLLDITFKGKKRKMREKSSMPDNEEEDVCIICKLKYPPIPDITILDTTTLTEIDKEPAKLSWKQYYLKDNENRARVFVAQSSEQYENRPRFTYFKADENNEKNTILKTLFTTFEKGKIVRVNTLDITVPSKWRSCENCDRWCHTECLGNNMYCRQNTDKHKCIDFYVSQVLKQEFSKDAPPKTPRGTSNPMQRIKNCAVERIIRENPSMSKVEAGYLVASAALST
mgnify:CR=1 FL=1